MSCCASIVESVKHTECLALGGGSVVETILDESRVGEVLLDDGS